MNNCYAPNMGMEEPVINFAFLPPMVRRAAEVFETKDERIVALISTIVAVGGIIPEVDGKYMNDIVSPNLYFFAIAPAASGKSALMVSRALVDDIHQEVLEISLKKQSQYKAAIKQIKNKKEIEALERPPFQLLVVPGNITPSKLIQQAQENKNGDVMIIESEADRVTQANRDDVLSDTFRAAYHSEPISISRKTDNEYYEVKKPKFSIILSGTPAQIGRFIPNAEDGLFSRFGFYSYNPPLEWKDPSPCYHCLNKTDILRNLAKDYKKLWKFFQGRKVFIRLSGSQWAALNERYKELLFKVASLQLEDNAISVVKRNGLMCYKIAMILTAIRMFELGINDPELVCEEKDFDTAMRLALILLDSSLKVLQTLPKSNIVINNKATRFDLFKLMPEEFTRAEWLVFAGENLVSIRTADRMLKQWTKEGNLIQAERGRYIKS
jgi:hypothetical protein